MIIFIKKNPALSITLLYIYMSCVGFTYQYFHLKVVGINVLNYASPTDFIMASGRAVPYVTSLLVIHILILIKDVIFNQKYAEGNDFKERCKNLVKKTKGVEISLLMALVPFFSGFMGYIKGGSISSHSCININVKLASALDIPSKSYLIETTEKYMFISSVNKHFVVKRDSVSSYSLYGTKTSSKKDAKKACASS